MWPSWIDLQDICASSTASGLGAVSSKGHKRSADDAINAIDRLADASLIIVESKKNAAQQIEAYSVKACMKILNSMPGLEANKKLKAAEAFEHANKRAIFVEMDEETRSLWVDNA